MREGGARQPTGDGTAQRELLGRDLPKGRGSSCLCLLQRMLNLLETDSHDQR